MTSSGWSSVFAGFRFPREVISVAVRWYLRYGLSYRDVEELLAERGVTVDHVTIYRWVQRFTPEFIEAARPCRTPPGDRWFVDETYVKVAGRWTYLYRAVDQHGQVIDVLLSRRDLAAARREERGMGQAIGGSLAFAVGIALSPIPIIAVVLMLTSAKAKVNGPLFVLGWLVGLGHRRSHRASRRRPGGASKSGSPATWVSWVKIVLGVLLLLVAVRQFRSRPRGGEEPHMPKWMTTIDKTTPLAAFGLAAALSGANPKNLLLAVAGAAAIAQTGIPGGQQALAYLVFAVIGTLGVGIPVGIYFALGERSARLLAGLKDWMSEHNAVIMTVLCLIIGAKLIGDAISSLTG